eukprot:TRINITY_DN10558_c0_g1_i8.p1 TRINITY_DN10558_c0_g1~~TRINITY_DN10558_c0_g1_i8.p1  ORF type:complete len:1079 (-),score=191.37 TRINITY_DN10558_c0_g1_i8:115-3351(-)
METALTKCIEHLRVRDEQRALAFVTSLLHRQKADSSHTILMHNAIVYKCVRVVEQLSKYHQLLNGRTIDHDTPLHLASYLGLSDIVAVLIQHGADLNARGNQGMTPLHYACQQQHTHIIDILLSNGAKVNIRDDISISPLHITVAKMCLVATQMLILHDAITYCRDESGNTPLHMATDLGHVGIIEYLIASGANVDSQNDAKQTPLHIACIQKRSRLVAILLQAGANQHILDNMGRTPRNISSSVGDDESVCLFHTAEETDVTKRLLAAPSLTNTHKCIQDINPQRSAFVHRLESNPISSLNHNHDKDQISLTECQLSISHVEPKNMAKKKVTSKREIQPKKSQVIPKEPPNDILVESAKAKPRSFSKPFDDTSKMATQINGRKKGGPNGQVLPRSSLLPEPTITNMQKEKQRKTVQKKPSKSRYSAYETFEIPDEMISEGNDSSSDDRLESNPANEQTISPKAILRTEKRVSKPRSPGKSLVTFLLQTSDDPHGAKTVVKADNQKASGWSEIDIGQKANSPSHGNLAAFCQSNTEWDDQDAGKVNLNLEFAPSRKGDNCLIHHSTVQEVEGQSEHLQNHNEKNHSIEHSEEKEPGEMFDVRVSQIEDLVPLQDIPQTSQSSRTAVKRPPPLKIALEDCSSTYHDLDIEDETSQDDENLSLLDYIHTQEQILEQSEAPTTHVVSRKEDLYGSPASDVLDSTETTLITEIQDPDEDLVLLGKISAELSPDRNSLEENAEENAEDIEELLPQQDDEEVDLVVDVTQGKGSNSWDAHCEVGGDDRHPDSPGLIRYDSSIQSTETSKSETGHISKASKGTESQTYPSEMPLSPYKQMQHPDFLTSFCSPYFLECEIHQTSDQYRSYFMMKPCLGKRPLLRAYATTSGGKPLYIIEKCGDLSLGCRPIPIGSMSVNLLHTKFKICMYLNPTTQPSATHRYYKRQVAVLYILCKTPRCLRLVLPATTPTAPQPDKAYYHPSAQERAFVDLCRLYKRDPFAPSIQVLENKPPPRIQRAKSPPPDFFNRPVIPSSKNAQLTNGTPGQGGVAFQCGRKSDTLYTVGFRQPLTPFVAFAAALANIRAA